MAKRICVFCGSSPGKREQYAQAARELGGLLVSHSLELVYGGGKRGLMGVVADAVLANGGHVIGVIPDALADKEVAHGGLPDLRVVGSMHERKALMADLSDAFISLPGGIGTLEECLETLTWAQLGFHRKPCGLLNVGGYYDPLVELLRRTTEQGFMEPEHLSMLLVESDAETLLQQCAQYRAPDIPRWIDRDQT